MLYATDATSQSEAGAALWPQRQLTVAIETTAIPDTVADDIGWGTRLPFYTNELPLLWGRPLDDGALLAGRELVPFDGTTDTEAEFAAAAARLRARIRATAPCALDD